MDRAFYIVVATDVIALLLPTRVLGPRIEFCLAVILIAATGVIWVRLRLCGEGR